MSILNMPEAQHIVFFDGYCNLCNGSVDLLMNLDRNRNLHYASLQGQTAMKLLATEQIKQLDSLVFWKGGEVYQESDALVRITSCLPWPWKVGTYMRYFPRAYRNRMYRWIAKNRYRWFGKKSSCRVPTAAESQQFLA